MNPFSSGSEAKKFLVAKIVEEASLHGAPLSDIERKCFISPKPHGPSPDTMVDNDEFDRSYDQTEYEKKSLAELLERIFEDHWTKA